MLYVLHSNEQFWYHSSFFLTASVGQVDFRSGFCYWWILWCHCISSFKRSQKIKRICETLLHLWMSPCAALLLLCHNIQLQTDLSLMQCQYVLQIIGLLQNLHFPFVSVSQFSLIITIHKVKSVHPNVNFNVRSFLSGLLVQSLALFKHRIPVSFGSTQCRKSFY